MSIDLNMILITKQSLLLVSFKKEKSFTNIQSLSNLVFLYSVPGHGAKIKQRMVYASCKESVITAIEKQYGITFDRKVNILVSFLLTIFFLFV